VSQRGRAACKCLRPATWGEAIGSPPLPQIAVLAHARTRAGLIRLATVGAQEAGRGPAGPVLRGCAVVRRKEQTGARIARGKERGKAVSRLAWFAPGSTGPAG
jgi:hypothetical protein